MTRIRVVAFATVAALMVGACYKVPVTGRKVPHVVPKGVMHDLGKASWKDMLANSEVKKGADNELLQKVTKKISKAAKQSDFAWQSRLFAEDDINAWALPGGYIGFYDGILPVLESEAGMAFVMGHEVAHATARHGAERMQQQLTLLGGLIGLGLFLNSRTELTDEQIGLMMAAIGLGAEFGVLLPFSRAHESEADVIGVMYMARAGYPPAESTKLWDRMSKATGGDKGSSFLSTHPTNKKRKEKIREWLPQAKKRYNRNKLDYDTLKARWR